MSLEESKSSILSDFDQKAQIEQLTTAVFVLKEGVQLKLDRLRSQIAQRDETIRQLKLELAHCADYASVKERLLRASSSGEPQVESEETPIDLSVGSKKSIEPGYTVDEACLPYQTDDCTQMEGQKRRMQYSGESVNQFQLATADILDTASIASKVRKLLGRHGIGQRLFARRVLGLSQGTVSELLSKPKPWPKLTEKGRESYKRMASWADNETNVVALMSTLPPTKKLSTKRINGANGKMSIFIQSRIPQTQPQPPPSSTSSLGSEAATVEMEVEANNEGDSIQICSDDVCNKAVHNSSGDQLRISEGTNWFHHQRTEGLRQGDRLDEDRVATAVLPAEGSSNSIWECSPQHQPLKPSRSLVSKRKSTRPIRVLSSSHTTRLNLDSSDE
ncbi:hypothetical protein BOX15_Mlig004399g1 [Macrostomum lignano]|uniref:CUT domain-containing protein n=1 Tax=Macrostomum lignano TaxID=282301 RepID=A0A267FHY2_9PLAT|nr:hypothetical protein BOX15_Mlig004399g1 [Macrostomum lignano]